MHTVLFGTLRLISTLCRVHDRTLRLVKNLVELHSCLMYDIDTRWRLSKCQILMPSLISLLLHKTDSLIEEIILSEVIVIVQ